jgi:16S rRNA (cytosine967-C5)-methyltransferase
VIHPPSTRFKHPESISPSRLEAARALFSLEKGSKVAEVLESAKPLKPEDTALFRELVYGCTRQKRFLDHHLEKLCQSPFQKLPVEVKISMRLGLYQLLFLDRVPAHAAVNEAVNLSKKGGHEDLSGFVNAVLRNAENKKDSLWVEGENDLDTLAIRFSHPAWLTKRWENQFGPERLEGILRADNQPHPVFLHVRPGCEEKVETELGRQSARLQPLDWPPRAYALKSHEGDVFSGESFQAGDWIIQDWVPQAMLELLPLAQGQRAWDLCAAPGGKTVGLAWKLGDKGQILASDASPERRKKLAENLKRTGLKQVMVHEGEAAKLPPAHKFDLIWVDAPCSGTGVLSRRADLRWKLSPDSLMEHVSQQARLLEEAQGHLYPKGFLVYSTCSLEKEENQEVVEAFLKSHSDWSVEIPRPPAGHPEILADEWGLTFLPTAEHDGGFLAILKSH